MKEKVHPNYRIVDVSCACGASFKTGTTKKVDTIKVEICNQCHPFYSGKQKMVDTGGRIDRFYKRFGESELK
jgi:large subunit ribosomal protein L31